MEDRVVVDRVVEDRMVEDRMAEDRMVESSMENSKSDNTTYFWSILFCTKEEIGLNQRFRINGYRIRELLEEQEKKMD